MVDCETLHQTTEADLKRPLAPDLEYYDATPSIEALAAQVAMLTRAYTAQTEINRRLIGANVDIRKKLIELEADMIKPEQRSALILPDHMKGN